LGGAATAAAGVGVGVVVQAARTVVAASKAHGKARLSFIVASDITGLVGSCGRFIKNEGSLFILY